MQSLISAFLGRLRAAVSYLWGYMGSVSAVALVLGVMAMGVHYTMEPQVLEMQRLRCYAGLRNEAGPEPPSGILPLGDALADALPVPHVRIAHNEDGQPLTVQHISAEGKIKPFPGSRVAEQRVEYDEAGRVLRKRNLDAAGRPVADAAGVATREFGYTPAGQLERTAFFDAAGQGVVPHMPGYAEQLCTYDSVGRPLMVRHLDATGRPIVNALGEETLEYEYDDAHGVCTRRNRVNGAVADNIHGVAIERTEATADGSARRCIWMNAAGEPVLNPAEDAVAVLEEHSAAPGLHRRLFCGGDGLQRRSTRPTAEHLQRHDSAGHVEWECYNAADGLPSVHPGLGYAERVCEYSPEGRLQREHFWDAAGNPARRYRCDHTHTDHGRYVLSLYTDGSSEIRPFE